MGFSSAAACVGLHNLPWNFHSHRQRVFKILCSSAKDTHQSPITLELSNPNKALRASSSQIEAVQFDERSSPFEVLSILYHHIIDRFRLIIDGFFGWYVSLSPYGFLLVLES